MDSQKVDLFIMKNKKFFESYQFPHIRQKLLNADESKWDIIQTLQFKDPTTCLIIMPLCIIFEILIIQTLQLEDPTPWVILSLLGGTLGIDRFYIGDTGLGVAKLITCGGLGIWTIIDLFLIMGAARKKNISKFQQVLY
jgi:hypothetical protein